MATVSTPLAPPRSSRHSTSRTSVHCNPASSVTSDICVAQCSVSHEITWQPPWFTFRVALRLTCATVTVYFLQLPVVDIAGSSLGLCKPPWRTHCSVITKSVVTPPSSVIAVRLGWCENMLLPPSYERLTLNCKYLTWLWLMRKTYPLKNTFMYNPCILWLKQHHDLHVQKQEDWVESKLACWKELHCANWQDLLT